MSKKVLIVALFLCFLPFVAQADVLPDIYHLGGQMTIKGCDTDGIGAGTDLRVGWIVNPTILAPQVRLWANWNEAKLIEGTQFDQGGAGTSLVFRDIIPELRLSLSFDVFAGLGKTEGEPVAFSTLTGGGISFRVAETEDMKTHLSLSGGYADVADINVWSIRAGISLELK